MIYALAAKVGPGCREVRAGADRATRPLLDRERASTLPRGGRWRTPSERAAGDQLTGVVGIVTRSPVAAGVCDRLSNSLDRVACWPT